MYFTITQNRRNGLLEFHFAHTERATVSITKQFPERKMLYGPNIITEEHAEDLARATMDTEVWVCWCDPKPSED